MGELPVLWHVVLRWHPESNDLGCRDDMDFAASSACEMSLASEGTSSIRRCVRVVSARPNDTDEPSRTSGSTLMFGRKACA